jgi:hypothetical protein
MKLTNAQKAALTVVGEAKKVWRHPGQGRGYWQIDRTGGCVSSGGELHPGPIEGLVLKGFCEIVDGTERKHNELARDQWIDYRFLKVALTDKGEAFLAGVLLE